MDKATILTDVNKITGRSETSIDSELLEALIEISERTGYLKSSTTGTTTAEQNYIDKPSDMAGNAIDGLELSGSPVEPVSWEAILVGRETGYCVRGDRIYLTPLPSDAESYALYYARLHPSDLDSILLPDVFKPAVKHLVCAKVYANYEISDKEIEQLTKFEREMAKFASYNATPPICRPYKGI